MNTYAIKNQQSEIIAICTADSQIDALEHAPADEVVTVEPLADGWSCLELPGFVGHMSGRPRAGGKLSICVDGGRIVRVSFPFEATSYVRDQAKSIGLELAGEPVRVGTAEYTLEVAL